MTHSTSPIRLEFTARCRAFATEGIRTHRLYWDGTVLRVWDTVAGHYTLHTQLRPRTIRRLVRAAGVVL